MADPRIDRIAARQAAQTAAAQVTVAPLIAAETLTDEQVAAVTAAFPAWSGDGVKVSVGDLRADEGVLYRCVQAHVTQPWASRSALRGDLTGMRSACAIMFHSPVPSSVLL